MALSAVSVDQRGQPVLAGLLYNYVQRFGMVRLLFLHSAWVKCGSGWLSGRRLVVCGGMNMWNFGQEHGMIATNFGLVG